MYLQILKFLHFVIILFSSYASANISGVNKPKVKDKFANLRITEKNYMSVKNIHMNWYTTSLKALMGQMGKQLYETLPYEEKRRLAKCLDNIEEKHDLIYAAKCLVASRKRMKALDAKKVQLKANKKASSSVSSEEKIDYASFKTGADPKEWIGKFKIVNDTSSEERHQKFFKKWSNIRRYPTHGSKRIPQDDAQISTRVFKNHEKMYRRPEQYPKNPKRGMVSTKKLNEIMRLSNIRRNMIQPKTLRRYRPNLKVHNRPDLSSTHRHTSYSTEDQRMYTKKFVPLRSTTLKRVYIGKPKRPKLVPVISPQPRKNLGTKIIQLPRQGKEFGITMIGSHPKGLESKHFEFKRKYFTSYRFEKYRMRRRFQRRFFAHRRMKRSEYRLTGDVDLPDDLYAPRFKFAQFLRNFIEFPKKSINQHVQDDSTSNGQPEMLAGQWPKTYNTLLKLHKEMEEKKKLPGAKPYKLRMYDIVLGNDEPSLSPKERKGPMGLIQYGMQMIQAIKGRNRKDDREGMNFKFLSPRFMPLMPDKMQARAEQLSPNIMSFYKDNNTIAAIPDILDAFGMSSHDRESVLSMLMDLTGSTKHVNTALDILKQLNFFDAGAEIMNATEKISMAYDILEKSFSPFQKSHLGKKGFAFLEKHQMERMLRDQGITNEIDLSDFDAYANYTHEQREEALWVTIECISNNITDLKTFKRHKRTTEFILGFPVHWLEPVILAPYMFAPTYGLGVLGPLVLSPFIFSPLILNPSVLSPFILSPGVAVPLILSPYVFGPFILGPYVMMPFILTPYAISPNVLNPYVLSPLILSPTGFINEIDLSDFDTYAKYTHEQREESLWLTIECISRNITDLKAFKRHKRTTEFILGFPVHWLEPTVLAPYAFAPTYGLGVLGPLVLSPFIFSPLILNPSVLSPFVFSPGVAVPLILSPYIFGPFIFGPYVMMPFILSPYAISPNIFNPYVLSPLILSPTVLAPDILSPQVLGGGVLSPTAGSPTVLTETALMGSVLSPSFLS